MTMIARNGSRGKDYPLAAESDMRAVPKLFAGVAESVDAPDSKSGNVNLERSNLFKYPSIPTNLSL